jgi:hypothetical protein
MIAGAHSRPARRRVFRIAHELLDRVFRLRLVAALVERY